MRRLLLSVAVAAGLACCLPLGEADATVHESQCWKHEAGDLNNAHGTVTNDGTAVTLNPFNPAWLPWDHWESLTVKGGPTSVSYDHPVSGQPYFAPVNPNSGKPYDVSHWIVCKGRTPQTSTTTEKPWPTTLPATSTTAATSVPTSTPTTTSTTSISTTVAPPISSSTTSTSVATSSSTSAPSTSTPTTVVVPTTGTSAPSTTTPSEPTAGPSTSSSPEAPASPSSTVASPPIVDIAIPPVPPAPVEVAPPVTGVDLPATGHVSLGFVFGGIIAVAAGVTLLAVAYARKPT